MSTAIARMQRANRGSDFRAYRLHGADPAQLDPFMGIDHAWMSAPTFPPHPHAGFSAVTYLFLDSETGIANRDSQGNSTLIEPGGLHWTAGGRGVVHEENPAVPGRTTHLLQIFVNLPREKQNAAPFALSLAPQDVPVVQRPGVRVRVPLGSLDGVRSPLTPPTDVTLLDVTLDTGAELALPVAAGQRAFFMPIFGSAELDGEGFGLDDLGAPILPTATEPTTHRLAARAGGAKVAVFIGEPLRQPVFSNGPMAFASQESLIAATAAYHRGDMGRL
ncbi:pirin family protein [Paraburkholderia panacisoli]|uniref:Pirin family protein n=1 Tax=Paraburkholderia panacisoli TaxID=2603818 RepID=A0A5B0GQI5_9BURK|nr:pirin family protein [Paraburkholderia panacisoli]KAA1004900.1 pirin family protein [Paraburkholderia panacisoli]